MRSENDGKGILMFPVGGQIPSAEKSVTVSASVIETRCRPIVKLWHPTEPTYWIRKPRQNQQISPRILLIACTSSGGESEHHHELVPLLHEIDHQPIPAIPNPPL